MNHTVKEVRTMKQARNKALTEVHQKRGQPTLLWTYIPTDKFQAAKDGLLSPKKGSANSRGTCQAKK